MFPFAVPPAGPGKSAAPVARAPAGTSLLEHAPALKDATERLVTAIVKNLQTMAGTATTIDGMANGYTWSTPRDLVTGHRADAVAASLACAAPSCTILATLDATLVHAMVELLCGGNGAEAPPTTPRPATSIDQQFANVLITLAAASIQQAWADLGFGAVRATKIEGILSAEVCGPRVASVAVISIALGAFGLTGTLRLALPPPALDIFGGVARETAPLAAGSDPNWSTLLRREIGRAPVTLHAFLEASDLSLGAIADLRIGQIVALPTGSRRRASLVCDGRELYRGEIGQADDRFSLRVDAIVADPSPAAPHDLQPRPLFETAEA